MAYEINMTPTVKKTWKLAKRDREFLDAMKNDAPEKYEESSMWWPEPMKLALAAMYWGWSVGKNGKSNLM